MYREISYSGWGSTRYSFNWAKTAGFLNKEIVNKYKELCEKNKDNKILNPGFLIEIASVNVRFTNI